MSEATNVLKNGGIVVFPTETVYGIGASVLNEKAIRKLYKAKRRPLTQKISILVGSIEMLEKVTKNLSKQERKLIEEFFWGSRVFDFGLDSSSFFQSSNRFCQEYKRSPSAVLSFKREILFKQLYVNLNWLYTGIMIVTFGFKTG